MRRMLFGALLAGVLFLALPLSTAGACHFGSEVPGQCPNPPEEQPFDPVPFASLADNRTGAHSNADLGWNQEEHEQFVVHNELDLNAAFGVDLDIPQQGEELADLDVEAIVSGVNTTIDGEIEDDNDGVEWPSNGVYRWLVRFHLQTGPEECEAFADKNAPDGHLHFEIDVCQAVIDAAIATDASVLEVTEHLNGTLQDGPFLTNPAVAGDYDNTVSWRAWDDPDTPEQPSEDSDTVTVTIANRVPTTVNLTPVTATRHVDQNHTATAEVLDQEGEALGGTSVDFEVTAGSHAGAKCSDVITAGNGIATCTYTETTATTDDNLRATATKFGTSASDNATVDWDEATTLDLTPATASKRVGTQHTLTATVRDDEGVVMSGETVEFTVSGANPGSGSDVTDAGGQATFTYTGNNAGNDSASAAVPGAPASDTATVDWDEPTTLDLTPATATKVVTQSHTLTALVKDDDGTPMSGETVDFSVAGANPGSGSDVTDANGEATFTYTGQNAGDDTVTSEVADTPASDTASVHWDAQVPTTLSLTPETAEHSVGQTHTATANVEDQAGNPIAGETVTFTVTAGPQQGVTGQDVTDASGNAEFTYTGNAEGTDTLEAVAGTASDTATIEWIGSIPTTLTVEYIPIQDPPGSLPRKTLFLEHETARWRLTVKDQDGEVMQGVTVRMDVETGPNTGTFQTAVTDANGQGIVGYSGTKANDEGKDHIALTVPGTDLRQTDDITWVWDPCDGDEPDATNVGPTNTGLATVRVPLDVTVQGINVEANACVN